MPSRLAAKLLKTQINLPLILTLAILPDLDLLMPFLKHRGPTHSLVVMLVASIPFFAIYRHKAMPYLVAAVQHSLVGDYIAGQVQLLWPLQTYFGINIRITDPINIAIEIAFFLAAIATMFATDDVKRPFKPHKSSLILIIPVATVLLPPLLAFPMEVPILLILPHIVFLILFLISILAYVLHPLWAGAQGQ